SSLSLAVVAVAAHARFPLQATLAPRLIEHSPAHARLNNQPRESALVVVIAGDASGPAVDIPTVHAASSRSPARVRSVRGGEASIIRCTRACMSLSVASVSDSVGSPGIPAVSAMSARNRRTMAVRTADAAVIPHLLPHVRPGPPRV